jgi:TonB family protein
MKLNKNQLISGLGLLALTGMALPLGAEVRVSHVDAVKNAVKRPNPEYNPMARQMRIQGDVEVEVKIADSGEVAEVKVVTGNPMLSAPVVKAVKDWKFTPFTEGGKPAPAVANLRFSFKQ